MEEGEFVDIMNEIRDILECDYTYEDEDEDDDDLMEGTEAFYYDRLKSENSPANPPKDDDPDNLLYAGYAECMEEAIRFLVEEENISPEHPVVKNLKTHLEKSKDRILQTLCRGEDNPDVFETPLSSIFLETFQNCRDSG